MPANRQSRCSCSRAEYRLRKSEQSDVRCHVSRRYIGPERLSADAVRDQSRRWVIDCHDRACDERIGSTWSRRTGRRDHGPSWREAASVPAGREVDLEDWTTAGTQLRIGESLGGGGVAFLHFRRRCSRQTARQPGRSAHRQWQPRVYVSQ